MDQSRWKSPVALLALAALIFFIVKTWFGIEIAGWDQFINLVIAAGVAVGIFNNPTDKFGY